MEVEQEICTSYFGKLKSLPARFTPVAIAVKPPAWYKGRRDPRLAPTYHMLRMSRAEYDRNFEQVLARHDPCEVVKAMAKLGSVCLLCYEKPPEWCHRRRVAEWLEQGAGIVVPEFGFERDDIPAYMDMESKPKAKRVGSTQRELW